MTLASLVFSAFFRSLLAGTATDEFDEDDLDEDELDEEELDEEELDEEELDEEELEESLEELLDELYFLFAMLSLL